MKKLMIGIVVIFSMMFSSNAFCDDFLFVSLEFPPLEYVGEDGEPTGIAVDVVNKIMTNLGHSIKVKIHPWSRSLKMTKDGDADAIFTAYKNPERETFLDYSKGVVAPQAVYFYKKTGSTIDFNGDMNSMKPYRIGVVSTISYGQKFDGAKSMLKIERVNKLEQNFAKILKGRIDLTLSNVYVGDYTLQRMNYGDKIEKIPNRLQSIPSYIAFSKKKKLSGLRDQFDLELGKIKRSGEYREIMKNYGVVM